MNLLKAKNKILALFLASLNLVTIAAPISYAQTTDTAAQVAVSSKENISQYGFSLKKSFSVQWHDLLEYRHEKSGMWLVVEKNNNADKRFEIMVRTPPENDKGINHIIEHCVLNGSEEYPCKNMLWELHQTLYNTFLNAMTFPCYTTFPVASLDEDELFSLAKIYTSGVFHPAFLKDERIFKKEGIRFELDSENKLSPNGTVFNEMQGNNPDMLDSVLKTIFPDTQSKNVSGGIPEKIMDLSYEEVCNTYKKYYHPSNMVVYMSGDINYERFMKFLDEEYLKNYDKINVDHIKYESQDKSKLPEEKTVYYYKQATDKNIISANVVSLLDYEFYIKNEYGLDILAQIINNANSERTKFLKSKGYLAIRSIVYDHFYDPAMVIELDSEKEDLVSPENTKKVLGELFEKYPIRQSEIDAIIGAKDFSKKLNRETNLYDSCLDSSHFIKSFIKFGDPCNDKYFGMLESKSVWWKKIWRYISKKCGCQSSDKIDLNELTKDLLHKQHKTIIVFKPSDDKSLSSKERLKAKIDSLQNKKDELTKNYQEQKAWAESPNDSQTVSEIKKMFKKLSQINTPKLACELEDKKIENVSCYHSFQDIGDFISYKLIFNISNLTQEELKYVELLANALNNNNTQKHSRGDLNELKSDTCRLVSVVTTSTDDKNSRSASMIVDIVMDKNKSKSAIELSKEQLFDIDFKDIHSLKKFVESTTVLMASTPKPLAKFYDILSREISPIYSYLNKDKNYDDTEKFYKEIQSNLSDEKFVDSLASKLENLRDKIFNINSLQGAGICSTEENEKLSEENLKDLLERLSKKDFEQKSEINLVPGNKKNIACIDPTTSNNNIACLADCKELSDSADFDVTCRIITDKFLAPNIREKSGAYGAGISRIPGTGKIVINSYCDPNLKSSIDIFKGIPEFIKNLNLESTEIENISKSLLGNSFPKNKLDLFSNQVEKLICEKLDYCKKINSDIDAIKNITTEKIKEHGKILEQAISNMQIYLISSDRKNIEENTFDEIFE